MRSLGIIFRFTFREQARKKSFLISTIIMMLAAAALVAVPAIVSWAQNRSVQTFSARSTLYLDDETSVTLDPAAVQKVLPGYTVKSVSAGQVNSVRRKILSGKNSSGNALAVFAEKNGVPSFSYYISSRDSGPDADKLAEAFRVVRAEHLLHRAGVTDSGEAADILRPVQYHTQTGDHSDNMSGFVPAIAVCILLFLTIYTYGYWVAMSIASEKTSRVLELLITSTKPSRIVIGKSLAMGALGLLQLLLTLSAGIAAYAATGGSGASFFSFSAFTPVYLVVFVVYFVLGFSLYAMMNAVAGATVSNADDLRTAVQPITIVGMISFYLSYGAFMAPGTPLSLVASLIPFSAPFSMPARLMMNGVPWWQIALSLAFLAAGTCVLAFASVRLYSSAVLHYGKRLRLFELFRFSRHL